MPSDQSYFHDSIVHHLNRFDFMDLPERLIQRPPVGLLDEAKHDEVADSILSQFVPGIPDYNLAGAIVRVEGHTSILFVPYSGRREHLKFRGEGGTRWIWTTESDHSTLKVLLPGGTEEEVLKSKTDVLRFLQSNREATDSAILGWLTGARPRVLGGVRDAAAREKARLEREERLNR